MPLQRNSNIVWEKTMPKMTCALFIIALLAACSPPHLDTTSAPTLKQVEQATTAVPTVSQTFAPVNTPQPTVTVEPVKPTVAPTVTPKLSQAAGLGLTRADAARMYQLLEFKFEAKTNEQGQEIYTGTISDNLAIVRLIGPKEDIRSASVAITVPKPPTQNQSSRTMAYLATLLTIAAQDWSEGTAWLNNCLNKTGESRTTFENREVVLVVTPKDNQTVVEFTISAK
jgi:hypothetical protein